MKLIDPLSVAVSHIPDTVSRGFWGDCILPNLVRHLDAFLRAVRSVTGQTVATPAPSCSCIAPRDRSCTLPSPYTTIANDTTRRIWSRYPGKWVGLSRLADFSRLRFESSSSTGRVDSLSGPSWMLGSRCGRLKYVHHGVVREFLILTLDDLVSFRVAARIAHCVSCPTPYRLALSLLRIPRTYGFSLSTPCVRCIGALIPLASGKSEVCMQGNAKQGDANKADANLDHRIRSPCHWETAETRSQVLLAVTLRYHSPWICFKAFS